MCTRARIKAFVDTRGLKDGEAWDEGFCNVLASCNIFVSLLSKNAFNHPTVTKLNFAKLQQDSSCDNVLVEHRLTLELKQKRGLNSSIFPVMISEKVVVDRKRVYGEYFKDNGNPSFETVEVVLC